MPTRDPLGSSFCGIQGHPLFPHLYDLVKNTVITGLGLTVVLTACAAPPLPQSTTTETTVSTTVDWSDFTLGPNDLIQVAVFGQPELSSPPTGLSRSLS